VDPGIACFWSGKGGFGQFFIGDAFQLEVVRTLVQSTPFLPSPRGLPAKCRVGFGSGHRCRPRAPENASAALRFPLRREKALWIDFGLASCEPEMMLWGKGQDGEHPRPPEEG
jgi:hypothetical protein